MVSFECVFVCAMGLRIVGALSGEMLCDSTMVTMALEGLERVLRVGNHASLILSFLCTLCTELIFTLI